MLHISNYQGHILANQPCGRRRGRHRRGREGIGSHGVLRRVGQEHRAAIRVRRGREGPGERRGVAAGEGRPPHRDGRGRGWPEAEVGRWHLSKHSINSPLPQRVLKNCLIDCERNTDRTLTLCVRHLPVQCVKMSPWVSDQNLFSNLILHRDQTYIFLYIPSLITSLLHLTEQRIWDTLYALPSPVGRCRVGEHAEGGRREVEGKLITLYLDITSIKNDGHGNYKN